MSHRVRLLGLALLAGTLPASAVADIVVGGYGDGSNPEPLRIFADSANGNVAPLRTLGGGPTSTLHTPVGGYFEPVEGVIYVADFSGQAIRIFAANASGDVAPKRVLDSVYVGQARSVAVDVAHQELLTFSSGCCLAAFDQMASGNVFYKRSVQWGGLTGSVTQLNYPYALVYMPATDEVALIDHDPAAPNAPKLMVFDRTASGNAAPKRVIKGANTGLGDNVFGLAYDAPSRRLFVGAHTRNPDSSRSARVLVFDDTADGDVAPVRSIAGAATGLELSSTAGIGGLSVDPQRQRLIASIDDYSVAANGKLLVFDLAANGNIAPLQVIAGAQTGLGTNLGAPIWVPAERIFGNGFE
ncbi:MAG: hypothetical protein JSS28_02575 [Proteobacteria bacterium]|nr:hypothetical protein [Pseudomonadota bacterium]